MDQVSIGCIISRQFLLFLHSLKTFYATRPSVDLSMKILFLQKNQHILYVFQHYDINLCMNIGLHVYRLRDGSKHSYKDPSHHTIFYFTLNEI